MASESLDVTDFMETTSVETAVEAAAGVSESHSVPAGHTNEHVETLSISTGMLIFSMILYMSFGTKLAHSSKYIGEGMSAAITGLALGGLLISLGNIILTQEVVEQLLTFDHANFFTFYLPPIILFAGLSVRKKAFFRNLPTIACMGIVGTYIAFAIIAGLLAAIAKVFPGITLADCLALGTIFATTDSVAVLQVLEQDRAPLLFSLVFGEGVINDATTVALLRTVQGLGVAPTMNFKTVCIIFGKFAYLFILSMIMGLACGFASSLLMKKFPATGTPQAVGLIGTTSYFAYLVGEHVGLSGIVVLFCCAVTMSHYAMHNLTKTQRAATMSAFETLSYFSEGSIFVYVGLDALDPAKWKYTHIGRAIGLSVIVVILLLFSRATFSFPVLTAHNYFASERVTWREMVIAWWAGAMRGAVSVALVYYYYDTEEGDTDPDHATLISMTLTVVLFSTLAFGAVTKPLLDFMLGVEDHDRGHSQGGEHGLELVPQPGGDASGPGHPALRPKALPHAVIEVQQDQPPGGLDEGYETDATAFTDGGYTTEEETPHHMRNKRHFLRGRPAGKPSALRNADNDDGEAGPMLAADNKESLERMASLLKGTAPDALIASPGGSPKASDVPADWQTFAQDGGFPSPTSALRATRAGNVLEAVGGPMPLPSIAQLVAGDIPSRRHHVHFADVPASPPERAADAMSQASAASIASAPLLGMSRAASTEGGDFSSRFRLPIRLGRAPDLHGRPRVQSQQLAEWWANFDERYMRPVFNRPGAAESWTPTSPEAHGGGRHHPSSTFASPVSTPGRPRAPGAAVAPAPHQREGSATPGLRSQPISPRSRTASFPPRPVAEILPARTSSTPTARTVPDAFDAVFSASQPASFHR